MISRNVLRSLLTALAFASMTGCGKSNLPAAPANSSAPSPDTTVRVHWLGKRGMELKMGSYYLMRIWRLQVSDDLQTRTLSQLASAPARLLAIPPQKAELANALLSASLKDVVQNECYLEVRQPANQPIADLAFAIHLDAGRVASWETNLANITGLLTGAFPSPSTNGFRGWSLNCTNPPTLLQFLRVNDWAVFGAGLGSNALFREIADRVGHYDDPFAAQASTNWLEADVNLARLPGSLAQAWQLSGNLPEISLTIAGDGANVLTQGKLVFPGPLPIECEPWTPPANLFPEPLDSFTAVRGFKPWLSSLKLWSDVPGGTPPGQVYFWALPGVAAQAFFAAPLPDASNQVTRLAEYLLEQTNPWLATNGYVKFERLPDSNGVSWGNMPTIRPFFKFVNAAPGSVIFGGLLPNTIPGTNLQANLYQRHSPSRLLDQLSARTNLVYFDWELTATRIDPCLYLGQVSRVVSRHAQLPLDSTSLKWLRAVAPGLGESTTMIAWTEPNQLTFFRQSTVGFTGAELQLLADWLESPQFPRGLYSSLTPLPSQP
ncbi:MAG: hypothetical protein WAO02_11885 [Verrucomicrobiia bacterium]